MSNRDAFYIASEFKPAMYSEEIAKHYVARLQSIMTKENKSIKNKMLPSAFAINQISKGLDITASTLSQIPNQDIGYDHVSLKVINRSTGIFLPAKVNLKVVDYVQCNLDICPPGENTELKIIHENRYDRENFEFTIQFYLGLPDNINHLFYITFKSKNKRWTPIKLSNYLLANGEQRFSVAIDMYFDNKTANELSLYRVQHAHSDNMSCSIAFFSSASDTFDATISIILLPWYKDAEKYDEK